MARAVLFGIVLVLSKGEVAEFKAIYGVPQYSRPLLVLAVVHGVVQYLIHLDEECSQIECQCAMFCLFRGLQESLSVSRPVKTPAASSWYAPGQSLLRRLAPNPYLSICSETINSMIGSFGIIQPRSLEQGRGCPC